MTENLEDSLDSVVIPRKIAFNYNDKAKCFVLKVDCSVHLNSVSIEQIEELKDRVEGLFMDHESELLEGIYETN